MYNEDNYSEDNYKKLLTEYNKQKKRINSIISMSDKQEFKMLQTNELLNNYKEIIDESSIVSKTDKNGIITYVNDHFIKLSGYSKDELIGKKHNIVHHADMNKDIFKEMWKTIKNDKLSWEGRIKNRKKNGEYYWVYAYIKPILDINNNIIEFIALRNDITQTEEYKEILNNKLTNTRKSLKDNMKYTKQYEDAIDKFTAVLKTDKNNYITYVNDKFCEISGFSKDELIGVNCKDIRDIKHIENDDCKMISEKLANHEIVSILFTNINKNSSAYYVDTVIYPIIDSYNNVAEHLHLMYDITELHNIHQEIEDTQKEIVYKMGEIGESRSKETGNHVRRVANYSKLLGTLYGLDDEQIEILFTASPMHYIGKVGIPDDILKKPGKLTFDEFKIMKTHSIIGRRVLRKSKRPILQAAEIVAYQHHEKYDGSGYPQGIKGENIHIFGRITALADVFDALGSDRCYKKAWDDEKIFKLFKDEKGKHFDPKLIDLFFEHKDKFLEIRDQYTD